MNFPDMADPIVRERMRELGEEIADELPPNTGEALVALAMALCSIADGAQALHTVVPLVRSAVTAITQVPAPPARDSLAAVSSAHATGAVRRPSARRGRP